MMAQTLSLNGIVEAQKRTDAYIVPQFLGFLIYFLASTAEVSRIPFDLPEAEGELVAGYHTEYGGMRWAMFQNAEYVSLIAFSAVGSILFLGGPRGPPGCPARPDLDAPQDVRVHPASDVDPGHAAPRQV